MRKVSYFVTSNVPFNLNGFDLIFRLGDSFPRAWNGSLCVWGSKVCQ